MIALYRIGKYHSAYNKLSLIKDIYNDYPFFYELKGDIHFKEGSFNKAIIEYEKAIKSLQEVFTPSIDLIKFSLIKTYLQTNQKADLNKSIFLLEELLLNNSNWSYLWRLLSKASGRLNKDDIERASLSLNIYGKSDLGIQASLGVVQVELQTALEDTMVNLKRVTTDLDTNESRFFTSYITDWIERGYYVPNIYQDFVEENPNIPQYIKDKARYRGRREDDIMMLGQGSTYDPGYSVSGTVSGTGG